MIYTLIWILVLILVFGVILWALRTLIPLPHPSGASTWPRSEPGKSLTARALQLLRAHPAWQSTFPETAPARR